MAWQLNVIVGLTMCVVRYCCSAGKPLNVFININVNDISSISEMRMVNAGHIIYYSSKMMFIHLRIHNTIEGTSETTGLVKFSLVCFDSGKTQLPFVITGDV